MTDITDIVEHSRVTEQIDQSIEGPAGIDDVFHQENVFTLQFRFRIVE